MSAQQQHQPTFNLPVQQQPTFHFQPTTTQNSVPVKRPATTEEEQQPTTTSTKRSKKLKTNTTNQPTITKRGTIVGQLSEQIADSNDPNTKPYGCAYPECLDAHPPVEFNNCGNLLAHWRTTHENSRRDIQRPFLCKVDGCLRDWKNIAGIRYHIQTAPDHFITDQTTNKRVKNLNPERHHQSHHQRRQNSNKPTTQADHPVPGPSSSTGPTTQKSKNSNRARTKKKLDPNGPKSIKNEERKAARKYHCPIDGCDKRYQQTSGLKYHLSNGTEHSQEIRRDKVHIEELIAKSTMKMLKARETTTTDSPHHSPAPTILRPEAITEQTDHSSSRPSTATKLHHQSLTTNDDSPKLQQTTYPQQHLQSSPKTQQQQQQTTYPQHLSSINTSTPSPLRPIDHRQQQQQQTSSTNPFGLSPYHPHSPVQHHHHHHQQQQQQQQQPGEGSSSHSIGPARLHHHHHLTSLPPPPSLLPLHHHHYIPGSTAAPFFSSSSSSPSSSFHHAQHHQQHHQQQHHHLNNNPRSSLAQNINHNLNQVLNLGAHSHHHSQLPLNHAHSLNQRYSSQVPVHHPYLLASSTPSTMLSGEVNPALSLGQGMAQNHGQGQTLNQAQSQAQAQSESQNIDQKQKLDHKHTSTHIHTSTPKILTLKTQTHTQTQKNEHQKSELGFRNQEDLDLHHRHHHQPKLEEPSQVKLTSDDHLYHHHHHHHHQIEDEHLSPNHDHLSPISSKLASPITSNLRIPTSSSSSLNPSSISARSGCRAVEDDTLLIVDDSTHHPHLNRNLNLNHRQLVLNNNNNNNLSAILNNPNLHSNSSSSSNSNSHSIATSNPNSVSNVHHLPNKSNPTSEFNHHHHHHLNNNNNHLNNNLKNSNHNPDNHININNSKNSNNPNNNNNLFIPNLVQPKIRNIYEHHLCYKVGGKTCLLLSKGVQNKHTQWHSYTSAEQTPLVYHYPKVWLLLSLVLIPIILCQLDNETRAQQGLPPLPPLAEEATLKEPSRLESMCAQSGVDSAAKKLTKLVAWGPSQPSVDPLKDGFTPEDQDTDMLSCDQSTSDPNGKRKAEQPCSSGTSDTELDLPIAPGNASKDPSARPPTTVLQDVVKRLKHQ
ncbi:hypothetical protein H4Q26_003208 [Puccinia striiformis f. sp. tritici PST-130]|nr:hypothetical protein H4Q26_003208 [Puccinia striiformis f. sp. tritici PST-130]